MPRDMGLAIPQCSAMRKVAELFLKGGFYVLKGPINRIFTHLFFFEFGLPVESEGQPRNAYALRALAVRGKEPLRHCDRGLTRPSCAPSLNLNLSLDLSLDLILRVRGSGKLGRRPLR